MSGIAREMATPDGWPVDRAAPKMTAAQNKTRSLVAQAEGEGKQRNRRFNFRSVEVWVSSIGGSFVGETSLSQVLFAQQICNSEACCDPSTCAPGLASESSTDNGWEAGFWTH
jgi:hypothetical protein